jgi:hypothetical protein
MSQRTLLRAPVPKSPPRRANSLHQPAHLPMRAETRSSRFLQRTIRQSPLPADTKQVLLQALTHRLEHPARATILHQPSSEIVAEFGLADWAYSLKTERKTLQQAIQHAEAIGLLRLDPIPYFKEEYFLCWTPDGVVRQPHQRRTNSQTAEEGACDRPAQGETEPPPRHWKGRPPRHVWRQLREAVLARDERTCHYCGTRSGKMSCDHVIPVSKGGSSTLDNLVTACAACNSAKATKIAEEWAQTRTCQPRRVGR